MLRDFGENARNYAVSNFSLSNMVESYERIYEETYQEKKLNKNN